MRKFLFWFICGGCILAGMILLATTSTGPGLGM